MSAIPKPRRPAIAPQSVSGREGIVLRIPPRAFTFDGFRKWAYSDDDIPEGVKLSFIGGSIWLEIPEEGFGLEIPGKAHAISGFREWIESDDVPEKLRVTFLNGEIILDMSKEELETHNKVKTEVMWVLGSLDRDAEAGTLYSEGVRVSNDDAGVSNKPDAVYLTRARRQAGFVRLVKRKHKAGQYIEIEGAPDWVMEVLSDSSVAKDKRKLRANYHKAGIREYWLIDARGEEIDFQILVWHKKGYTAAPKKDDWQRSPVFSRFFRLTRKRDKDGDWLYRLESQSLTSRR